MRDSFLVKGVAFKKTFSYAGFEQQRKQKIFTILSRSSGVKLSATDFTFSASSRDGLTPVCSLTATIFSGVLLRTIELIVYSFHKGRLASVIKKNM